MKKLIGATIFSLAIIFSSCSNTKTDENAADSDDLNALTTPGASNIPPVNMNSNLNYVDANGNRQGKWIIYGKMQDDKSFGLTSKVEEGEYKDNLKDGEWTEYNPDGKVKRTVKYAAGKEVK